MRPPNVEYVRVEPNMPLPEFSRPGPFKAVVILDAELSPEWRHAVGKWLLDSGCLYLMAWGSDCEAFHDAVDYANISAFPNYEVPDEKFVMTTWHENESLEEVFWFSQFCAEFSYNEEKLPRTMILHVSNQDREAEIFDLFDQASTLVDREPD